MKNRHSKEIIKFILILISVKFGVQCLNNSLIGLSWPGIDIGVGSEGSVYLIDIKGALQMWTGSGWNPIPFAPADSSTLSRITVDDLGNPWVVTNSSLIYIYNITQRLWSNYSNNMLNVNDIGSGGGQTFCVTSNSKHGTVFQLNTDLSWTKIGPLLPAGYFRIDADPFGVP